MRIYSWKELKEKYPIWDTLLLGNGASIAIHDEFCYSSLYDKAKRDGLLSRSEAIFKQFDTENFEHVLLACWYAEKVNTALGITGTEGEGDVLKNASDEVRNSLINAVHGVHPKFSISSELKNVLKTISEFAKDFKTIFVLNYDLLFYWAMNLYNDNHKNWFKDLFVKDSEFVFDLDKYRVPFKQNKGASLVFYPHGNIFISRDCVGIEKKLNLGGEDNFLECIKNTWENGDLPVFVSEGKSEQKLNAIRRSRYLSRVYEDLLSKEIKKSLVIYGWSFSENDGHIMDAIAENDIERIAVSVYTGGSDEEKRIFCDRVNENIKNMKNRKTPKRDVETMFFDSRSPGCWNNK